MVAAGQDAMRCPLACCALRGNGAALAWDRGAQVQGAESPSQGSTKMQFGNRGGCGAVQGCFSHSGRRDRRKETRAGYFRSCTGTTTAPGKPPHCGGALPHPHCRYKETRCGCATPAYPVTTASGSAALASCRGSGWGLAATPRRTEKVARIRTARSRPAHDGRCGSSIRELAGTPLQRRWGRDTAAAL